MTPIDQADRIVFGDDVTVLRVHNMLNANRINIDTLRRGAYIEWAAKHQSFNHLDAPRATADIDRLASYVVALHAKANEVGDGLGFTQDRMSIATTTNGNGTAKVTIFLEGRGDDACNLIDYIRKCLTKPVRKLLHHFEVVESEPTGGSVEVTHYIIDRDGDLIWHTEPPVCWLVPRKNP